MEVSAPRISPPPDDTSPRGWRRRFSAAGALRWAWQAVQTVLGTVALLLTLAAIYYLSHWLRFEGELPALDRQRLEATIVLAVLLKFLVLRWFHVAPPWEKGLTYQDLAILARATTFGILATLLVDRCLLPAPLIPRSIYLIDWGTTVLVLGGGRGLLSALRERCWRWPRSEQQVRALIVGANTTGAALLQTLIRSGRLTYRVVGFIDDDPQRRWMRIAGLPVLGSIADTCRLAARHRVQAVLIVQDALSSDQLRWLFDAARRHNLAVQVLPGYEQLLEGNVSVVPRPVAIEDLLHRAPAALDLESIRNWIDGQVLLVTGSAGSIGSEICRQLLRFAPRRVVLVDRSETAQFFLERELRQAFPDAPLEVCLADVLDKPRMLALIRRFRPKILFHAAAYKHVPLMESHPGEAVKNIVEATRRLADLAAGNGLRSFVMISTDKAVRPTSVMGACKRVAELYVQSQAGRSDCRFVTVRFGNVLDSAGSVVPIFRQQIAAGGPITITDPGMERYFMTIPEAARLVIQAGAIGEDGEILTLDMGQPVKIVELARDMIRLSGLEQDKDIRIEYVGLRPGEKLVEELRLPTERTLPTRHSSIIIADREPVALTPLEQAVSELERVAALSPERVVDALLGIVGEYRPERADGRRTDEGRADERRAAA
mgnify:FL=1